MHGLRIIWKILATIANLATKQFVFLHPSGNAKLRALLQGTFLHRLFLCGSWTDVFSLLSCFRDDQAVCLHHVLPYSELSTQMFTLGQLRLLYWTGNIPGTENSCKCNRTNSFWPKSPYASGTESAISGFGPSSYSLIFLP